ncbi:hypothetical protein [Streptomyces sp. NPDC057253]|uniref:hypothetical protein n=1 Tax=Streptomyces sp. NPDC057253 TaxID=3346069 RepID=UPI0036341F7F
MRHIAEPPRILLTEFAYMCRDGLDGVVEWLVAVGKPPILQPRRPDLVDVQMLRYGQHPRAAALQVMGTQKREVQLLSAVLAG